VRRARGPSRSQKPLVHRSISEETPQSAAHRRSHGHGPLPRPSNLCTSAPVARPRLAPHRAARPRGRSPTPQLARQSPRHLAVRDLYTASIASLQEHLRRVRACTLAGSERPVSCCPRLPPASILLDDSRPPCRGRAGHDPGGDGWGRGGRKSALPLAGAFEQDAGPSPPHVQPAAPSHLPPRGGRQCPLRGLGLWNSDSLFKNPGFARDPGGSISGILPGR